MFFQSAGSCPVCKVFSNKKPMTEAISIFNCFKTTGLMESGPAALSGFRFDNSFKNNVKETRSATLNIFRFFLFSF